MVLHILYECICDIKGQGQRARIIQSEINSVAEMVAIALSGCFVLFVFSIVIIIMLLL